MLIKSIDLIEPTLQDDVGISARIKLLGFFDCRGHGRVTKTHFGNHLDDNDDDDDY